MNWKKKPLIKINNIITGMLVSWPFITRLLCNFPYQIFVKTSPSVRLSSHSVNSSRQPLLLSQENAFKDELPRTRLWRRQVRKCCEPKFPLCHLLKHIQRSYDVREKSTLLLSSLYYQTSWEFAAMSFLSRRTDFGNVE